MMSLFSSFDFFIFGSSFIFSLMFIFFLTLISINKISLYFNFLKELMNFLTQIIYVVKMKQVPKILALFCNCFFLMLFLMNFSSIFPFSFSFTTQMSIIFLLSIWIWMSFIFFSLKNNWKNLISHKIPEGCPMSLSIFLFLIEIISEIIRPLTLTLRLVGNMVVGHVLLSLLFKLVYHFNFVFPFFIFLNMIEVLVCLIQAYIFFTLVTMYWSEM